ncbi:MAG: GNAT family N-acetyltransferase [Rhodocyclaceae bacterium]|jgi:predicted N-acetyltransferase YhbS|nr:GNAT family N-acetyltransferase [Rhodocyclaceae bacterium]MBK6675556.1 GNAT family N-acetyltransferase [Rhodocyclaceae bacterium]MBK9312055.1 GNAT family N-acetyltransferase [Rhodocyclaceae bacterium]MBK9956283.1 GNAT family N-acetyltransferase [Rhodocyclaceae bacterium]
MAAERIMRVLKKGDLEGIVAIDTKITNQNRREYYARKIDTITDPERSINTSIVAELDGKVVGFIMGDVYFGEFGIPETSATIDTLGVDPSIQNKGLASELLDQFMMNMKAAGVNKVYTLVNWDDFALEKFFSRHKFVPSKRINLEFQMP